MGMCPMPRAVPKFDKERFYGAWYYQMQIPSFYQEMDLSCARGFWRPRDDGSVSVYFTGIMDSDGGPEEMCGKLWQDNEDNPGNWKASLPGSPIYGEANVLDTDYDSYAVVYSCYQFLFFKYELGWILTREAIASQVLIDNAMSVLERNGIDKQQW